MRDGKENARLMCWFFAAVITTLNRNKFLLWASFFFSPRDDWCALLSLSLSLSFSFETTVNARADQCFLVIIIIIIAFTRTYSYT